MIIQKIQTAGKTVYKKNNTKINIDTFYDILDAWDFMCYRVKSYTMRKENTEIITYYVDKNI